MLAMRWRHVPARTVRRTRWSPASQLLAGARYASRSRYAPSRNGAGLPSTHTPCVPATHARSSFRRPVSRFDWVFTVRTIGIRSVFTDGPCPTPGGVTLGIRSHVREADMPAEYDGPPAAVRTAHAPKPLRRWRDKRQGLRRAPSR